jgi:hypothetical protein
MLVNEQVVAVSEPTGNPFQHSGRNGFYQYGAPSRLKTLAKTTFHTWTQYGGQDLDQCVYRFIPSSEAFDFPIA